MILGERVIVCCYLVQPGGRKIECWKSLVEERTRQGVSIECIALGAHIRGPNPQTLRGLANAECLLLHSDGSTMRCWGIHDMLRLCGPMLLHAMTWQFTIL